MLQFSDLVRGSEVVRDVKQKYPETAPVFEKFQLRTSCDDCSIEMSSRKAGVPLDDLLVAVNAAIYHVRGVAAQVS